MSFFYRRLPPLYRRRSGVRVQVDEAAARSCRDGDAAHNREHIVVLESGDVLVFGKSRLVYHGTSESKLSEVMHPDHDAYLVGELENLPREICRTVCTMSRILRCLQSQFALRQSELVRACEVEESQVRAALQMLCDCGQIKRLGPIVHSFTWYTALPLPAIIQVKPGASISGKSIKAYLEEGKDICKVECDALKVERNLKKAKVSFSAPEQLHASKSKKDNKPEQGDPGSYYVFGQVVPDDNGTQIQKVFLKSKESGEMKEVLQGRRVQKSDKEFRWHFASTNTLPGIKSLRGKSKSRKAVIAWLEAVVGVQEEPKSSVKLRHKRKAASSDRLSVDAIASKSTPEVADVQVEPQCEQTERDEGCSTTSQISPEAVACIETNPPQAAPLCAARLSKEQEGQAEEPLEEAVVAAPGSAREATPVPVFMDALEKGVEEEPVVAEKPAIAGAHRTVRESDEIGDSRLETHAEKPVIAGAHGSPEEADDAGERRVKRQETTPCKVEPVRGAAVMSSSDQIIEATEKLHRRGRPGRPRGSRKGAGSGVPACVPVDDVDKDQQQSASGGMLPKLPSHIPITDFSLEAATTTAGGASLQPVVYLRRARSAGTCRAMFG
eukprot:jgi/Mesen1/8327/ME000457S07523